MGKGRTRVKFYSAPAPVDAALRLNRRSSLGFHHIDSVAKSSTKGCSYDQELYQWVALTSILKNSRKVTRL